MCFDYFRVFFSPLKKNGHLIEHGNLFVRVVVLFSLVERPPFYGSRSRRPLLIGSRDSGGAPVTLRSVSATSAAAGSAAVAAAVFIQQRSTSVIHGGSKLDEGRKPPSHTIHAAAPASRTTHATAPLPTCSRNLCEEL